MNTKDEFDKIIRILQNPTRRKILERLSREEHYPLQISETLNTSQQAISKHLKTMEKAGLVVSKVGKSNRGGPPTKIYMVNSEFSLRIDLGPALFRTEVDEIEIEEVKGYEDIENKIDLDQKEGFLKIKREVIKEIEDEIEDLKKKRQYLLKLKEKALSKGYEYIYDNFDDYMERFVLYYILDTGHIDPQKLAKDFEIREDRMKEIIDNLKEKTELW